MPTMESPSVLHLEKDTVVQLAWKAHVFLMDY